MNGAFQEWLRRQVDSVDITPSSLASCLALEAWQMATIVERQRCAKLAEAHCENGDHNCPRGGISAATLKEPSDD